MLDEKLIEKATRHFLENDGHHMPTVFAETADKKLYVIGIHELGSSDYNEKRIAQDALRMFFAINDIVNYTVITEAWMGMHGKPGGPPPLHPDDYPRPSEDPNRVEALIIFYSGGDRKCIRCFEIKRDTSPPTLTKLHELDSAVEGQIVEGAMVNLLPTPDLKEKLAKKPDFLKAVKESFKTIETGKNF